MANMVITNDGKIIFLQHAMAMTTLDSVLNYYVRLYSNDYTPDDDSELADFTSAAFDGFSPVIIAYDQWDNASIVANVAEIVYSTAPVFTCTGGTPETVYGWYLADAGDTIVVAAQRFDSPREMVSGAVIALDPFKFKLKTFA